MAIKIKHEFHTKIIAYYVYGYLITTKSELFEILDKLIDMYEILNTMKIRANTKEDLIEIYNKFKEHINENLNTKYNPHTHSLFRSLNFFGEECNSFNIISHRINNNEQFYLIPCMINKDEQIYKPILNRIREDEYTPEDQFVLYNTKIQSVPISWNISTESIKLFNKLSNVIFPNCCIHVLIEEISNDH